MAFIEKKDPVVLNIKVTSKGRELLSKGSFNFKYFSVGDSEINYDFIRKSNIVPSNLLTLRPIDNNPKILSPIKKNLNNDGFNDINTVTSIPTIIENNVDDLGFFYYNNNVLHFNTESTHIKQPDILLKVDEITGGSVLNLYKSSTYLGNVSEPSVGDFLLVKWVNPVNTGNTTGYSININIPNPILIYKVTDIISGTLFNDNLIVSVDRELPNFNLLSGNTGLTSGALLLYSSYSDKFSTEYLSDETLTFLNNNQCNVTTFPYWKLSIVYLNDILGVDQSNKSYLSYKSNVLSGFASYIQNQEINFDKIGIIHYTNQSPNNYYGEEFFRNTPQLYMPTIMWHKAQDNKMGVTLKPYGNQKMLTGETLSLNTKYYDLADNWGNVVGKVFTDFKVFIIEDQELLFAMSYKSNRSWTLPNYVVGVNDNVVIGCVACYVSCEITVTTPSKIGGIDGKIMVNNIKNNIGTTILEIKNGSNDIFYNKVTGDTEINNLGIGSYTVNLYDLGSPNCKYSSGVTINNPTSELSLYDINSTTSGLDSNFRIISVNNSVTQICISKVYIGDTYGVVNVGYKRYDQSDSSIIWSTMVTSVVFNNLTFRTPYIIYVSDSGTTPTIFNHVVSRVYYSKFPVINTNYSVTQSMNNGDVDINIIGITLSINPNVNPIVGKLQYSVYKYLTEFNKIIPPIIWHDIPIGVSNINDVPIYGTGDFIVSIREIWDNNVIEISNKTITVVSNNRI
jgi:hypothetical protein